MKNIEHFILPEQTNALYANEAVSSISLTKNIADKLNEIIDLVNSFSEDDLQWKQEQEGTIRKGVLFMKDNLLNSLHDLLKIYEDEKIKNLINEIAGKELSDLKVFVTPQMFGAVGDGIANDTLAIERAIESLAEGGILYFPKGTYLMTGKEVVIDKPHITFAGDGLILCDYGFRPKASHFKAIGIKMESVAYSTESRAFMIDNSDTRGDTTLFLENFSFKDCYFKNFFYSVCSVGGSYNFDGTEASVGYPIRDVVIDNCYSITYDDKNAGHFQSIQIENISYINNRTYGGKNASSYNAIKGNGFIRVIGNYDHNNSYASCEIENGSGKVVIANNTFNSKIWIDDSFDVVVNANTTEEGISVTVGSNTGDAENIIISNNTCKNIRCERFSNYSGGLIKNVNIISNNVKGTNTHGIWIHGNAVKSAKVCNNFISGSNTNDIAIQRNAQIECIVQNNYGNGNTLLIAGSSGKVYVLDNYNMNVSGTRDSLPVSHYERSFNGLKITDTSNVAWRVNVNTSGEVFTTQY